MGRRKNIVTLLLVTLLFLAAGGAAHATDYYVATTGSDSNNGTSVATAFRTIQKGADLARAGDTVIVLPGTYNEAIKQTNDGAASGRIHFLSQTKWGAKVVSSGSNVSWAVFGDYVDVDGFDLTAADNAHFGIVLYGSNTRALYNHVHHYRAPDCSSGVGGAGIHTQHYDTVNKDIIGNVVHHVGTAAPTDCNLIHGIYPATRGGKVQNNIVYNAAGAGIHLNHAPIGTVVSHNLSFNNLKSGIIFGCGDAPHVQCSGIQIYNNIVMNNKGNGIRERGNNDSSNRVVNNIIYQNLSDTPMMVTGTATGNLIGVNPQLVNFQPNGGGDYHPAAGSPAIDAATFTGCAGCQTVNDIDLGARPVGAGHDIGPYEFGAPPGTTPLPPPGGGDGGTTPPGLGGGLCTIVTTEDVLCAPVGATVPLNIKIETFTGGDNNSGHGNDTDGDDDDNPDDGSTP